MEAESSLGKKELEGGKDSDKEDGQNIPGSRKGKTPAEKELGTKATGPGHTYLGKAGSVNRFAVWILWLRYRRSNPKMRKKRKGPVDKGKRQGRAGSSASDADMKEFGKFVNKVPVFGHCFTGQLRNHGISVTGTPMRVLYLKMKRSKNVLKEFNKTHFGGITIKVADKRRELDMVQNQILSIDLANSKHELIKIESKLISKLQNLLVAEESFFRQKSRIQWIKEGDQNTRFFHKSVNARRN
ncbi:hypothetical protein DITRI_Ditri07aG0086900 [Diplodiscus trichospermus]